MECHAEMLEFPPVPYLEKQSFSEVFMSAEWDKIFGILIDVLILKKYSIQKERVHLNVLDRNTGAGQWQNSPHLPVSCPSLKQWECSSRPAASEEPAGPYRAQNSTQPQRKTTERENKMNEQTKRKNIVLKMHL